MQARKALGGLTRKTQMALETQVQKNAIQVVTGSSRSAMARKFAQKQIDFAREKLRDSRTFLNAKTAGVRLCSLDREPQPCFPFMACAPPFCT